MLGIHSVYMSFPCEELRFVEESQTIESIGWKSIQIPKKSHSEPITIPMHLHPNPTKYEHIAPGWSKQIPIKSRRNPIQSQHNSAKVQTQPNKIRQSSTKWGVKPLNPTNTKSIPQKFLRIGYALCLLFSMYFLVWNPRKKAPKKYPPLPP